MSKRICINGEIIAPHIMDYLLRAKEQLGIPFSYSIARLLEFGAMADPIGIGAPPTREELAKREAAEKAKAEAAQKEARENRIRQIRLEVCKSGEANPLPGESKAECDARFAALVKARLAAEGISEE